MVRPVAVVEKIVVWRAIRLIPLLCAVAGLLIPLVATGGSVWPATAVWAGIVAAVAIAAYRFPTTRRSRLAVMLIALPLLLAAGWEGGWWLMPAALAEIAVDLVSPEAPRTV